MNPFSVIIPVHQEAVNLENFVALFLGRLEAAHVISRCLEILLVENGSRDATKEACERLAAANPLIKTFSVTERSYGEALRQGILRASGDYLFVLECDFLDLNFLSEGLSLLDGGKADLVVSSKRRAGLERSRPFARRLLTRGFNGLLKLATGYPGTDTRGLKAGRSALFRELTGLALTRGEVFQTELVLIAWKKGSRIREVPLPVREKRKTRLGVLARSFAMLPAFYGLRQSLSRFEGADSE